MWGARMLRKRLLIGIAAGVLAVVLGQEADGFTFEGITSYEGHWSDRCGEGQELTFTEGGAIYAGTSLVGEGFVTSVNGGRWSIADPRGRVFFEQIAEGQLRWLRPDGTTTLLKKCPDTGTGTQFHSPGEARPTAIDDPKSLDNGSPIDKKKVDAPAGVPSTGPIEVLANGQVTISALPPLGKNSALAFVELVDVKVRPVPADRRIFAGTANGVMRLDEKAGTWVPSGLSGKRINALYDRGPILAATSDGIHRSDDFGATWLPLGPQGIDVKRLAFGTLCVLADTAAGDRYSSDLDRWAPICPKQQERPVFDDAFADLQGKAGRDPELGRTLAVLPRPESVCKMAHDSETYFLTFQDKSVLMRKEKVGWVTEAARQSLGNNAASAGITTVSACYLWQRDGRMLVVRAAQTELDDILSNEDLELGMKSTELADLTKKNEKLEAEVAALRRKLASLEIRLKESEQELEESERRLEESKRKRQLMHDYSVRLKDYLSIASLETTNKNQKNQLKSDIAFFQNNRTFIETYVRTDGDKKLIAGFYSSISWIELKHGLR